MYHRQECLEAAPNCRHKSIGLLVHRRVVGRVERNVRLLESIPVDIFVDLNNSDILMRNPVSHPFKETLDEIIYIGICFIL